MGACEGVPVLVRVQKATAFAPSILYDGYSSEEAQDEASRLGVHSPKKEVF